MAKTYVSEITPYLDDAGDLKEVPASVRRMAEFLFAIVEAVTPKIPALGYNTGVRCRKRGCKGSIQASLQSLDGKIASAIQTASWCLQHPIWLPFWPHDQAILPRFPAKPPHGFTET